MVVSVLFTAPDETTVFACLLNLATAREYSDRESITEVLGYCTNISLDSPEVVMSCLLVELVKECNLQPISDHTMPGDGYHNQEFEAWILLEAIS